MPTDHRAALANIKTFPQLIAYLRDEMGWPIARDSFEDVDDLFYDFTADELGIDPKTAAKITEIKRLRPLSTHQPWGIFFVKFEPKKLPVVALRRILSQVALKKRASANSADRTAWAADDLLFVSNYGEGSERQISFAHFAKPQDGHDLPTLKVLGWDNRDTALHLDAVAKELTEQLSWPKNEGDVEAWRKGWRGAFTLRHGEVVTTSKELSIRLAKLAGDIRDRIKSALAIETDRGPLTKLMKAFQTSLVHDLDADGFADMYAQTIAYGLLSARIADPHKKTVDDFAGHMRTNPFLRELMETFLKVGGRRGKAGGPGIDFDELGVSEVVQLLDDANMEAVVLDFGDKNPQEDPVIHFYELFLKEYDAKKRMQRGVFYTPRPVVSYIVRSVDELLRTEFGLEDGLADTTTWGEMAKRHKNLKIPEGTSPDQAFVQILDPATGTGTFLVEVIDIIHKTMVAKWKAQGQGEKKMASLWNDYVPKHLLPRLHAYELLMAPYAIAHLKVGLKLYETGYRFGSDERARIYLTNALEPAQDFSGTLEFAIPALAHEAQAVNEIKRKERFTVIVGNPPYSHWSANLGPQQRELVEAYKYVRGERIRERGALQFELNIQDDYVKFIRIAELAICSAGSGVVGLITNNAYLDSATFRGLRSHLLDSYTLIRILDLHGSAKAIQSTEDKNVFDIQQGVAIAISTKRTSVAGGLVKYGELIGAREMKYRALMSHPAQNVTSTVMPRAPDYLFLSRDESLAAEYEAGIAVDRMFSLSSSGVKTNRDGLTIAHTQSELDQRMDVFCDKKLSDADVAEALAIENKNYWNVRDARKALSSQTWRDSCSTIEYRPFDQRCIVYHPAVVFSPRRPVMVHLGHRGNLALLLCRQQIVTGFAHVFVTRNMFDCCLVSNRSRENTSGFPLYLVGSMGAGESLFVDGDPLSSNLTQQTVSLFRQVVGRVSDENILEYMYALLHSPQYRQRYVAFLRRDFPRIPLPGSPDLFHDLACLGRALIALHLMELPKLDQPITTYIGPKNPEVGRVGWSNETVWLNAAATKKGQPATPGTIGFRGVPEAVWNFQLGSYQVCDKWLKDRKGRTLTKDDIAHYQKIVVALAETIRLMQEIDVVIEQHGGWPGAFQTGEAQAATPKVIPFRPRIVQPGPKERYVTCVPLVPLKVAAGAFSDPQHIDDDGFEWAAVETKRRLRSGMFVAQVVGKSMEPAIPDGAYCLFVAPVEGTRQGKTVLVQLRDATDPESGERYTVKRYESEKAQAGDSWRHEKITLKPVNPDFKPIVLTGADEGELQVIAEFVEVLGGES